MVAVMADMLPRPLAVGVEADAKSVVVVDAIGEIFATLRELQLPAALWRVLNAHAVAAGLDVDLTICAVYGPIAWDDLAVISPRSQRVVITTTFHRGEAQQALDHELVGYIDAGMEPSALARVIRGILLHGESAFPRDVIGDWVRARQDGHRANAGDGLTPRQQEIVTLIASGATDKEIAAALGIAPATAQKHVTNILQRLHVPNRAAAVAVTSRLVRS